MRAVLHPDPNLLVPRMVDEGATDHVDVLRPSLSKRVRAAVRHQDRLAVLPHEAHQVSLLLLGDLQVALRVEHHGVEVVEVLAVAFQLLLGHQFHVRAEAHVEQAGALADLGHREHRVRHRVVREEVGTTEHQQVHLFVGVLGCGRHGRREQQRGKRCRCEQSPEFHDR